MPMRKTVYDQLLELQVIPDAWEEWKAYREALVDWIIESTEENDTALVVGAGACNDMDLTKMSKHFSHLYLLDQDEKAMEKALKKQIKDSALLTKIDLIQADIVGISPEKYRIFSEKLQEMIQVYGKECDVEELAEIALAEMEHAYETRQKADAFFRENSVDHVIACGIHSQLNSMYPWIWEAYCEVLGKRDPRVHQKASEYQNRLMPQINDYLLKAARKRTLFALEAERIGVQGGVEGAFQGLIDLRNRQERGEIEVLDLARLIWPFCREQNVVYDMNLLVCAKTEG